MVRAQRALQSPTLASLVPSWELALEASNKSKRTIRSYTDTARWLAKRLAENELPVDVDDVEPKHIRMFLAAEIERTSPASAALQYRNLSVFWNWLVAEEERPEPSPMQSVEKLTVPTTQKMPMDDAELVALMRTCRSKSFEDRRDLAMMRILIDNGMRGLDRQPRPGIASTEAEPTTQRGPTPHCITHSKSIHLPEPSSNAASPPELQDRGPPCAPPSPRRHRLLPAQRSPDNNTTTGQTTAAWRRRFTKVSWRVKR